MLSSVSLQNFRNYKKSQFEFFKETTILVGPNTAGKSNLIEAIFLLATGKSFRGRDEDMIGFGKDFARVKGTLSEGASPEVAFARQDPSAGSGQGRFSSKFLVNGVSKRRADFVGQMPSVLFTPLDLELITDGPSVRRHYLDTVLEQTDREYARAKISYDKALRHRNKLLEEAKKLRHKNHQVFDYWDNLLIENGKIITGKREEYIMFVNAFTKDVFDFAGIYDKSTISKERLLQYEQAEIEATVTLVGPHRDDVGIEMFVEGDNSARDVRIFGSRGQQRLVVLQLKIIELAFIEKQLGEKPLLLLDDIFSELDSAHIDLVLSMVKNQQTILTTTHKEFIQAQNKSKNAVVIELSK